LVGVGVEELAGDQGSGLVRVRVSSLERVRVSGLERVRVSRSGEPGTADDLGWA